MVLCHIQNIREVCRIKRMCSPANHTWGLDLWTVMFSSKNGLEGRFSALMKNRYENFATRNEHGKRYARTYCHVSYACLCMLMMQTRVVVRTVLIYLCAGADWYSQALGTSRRSSSFGSWEKGLFPRIFLLSSRCLGLWEEADRITTGKKSQCKSSISIGVYLSCVIFRYTTLIYI